MLGWGPILDASKERFLRSVPNRYDAIDGMELARWRCELAFVACNVSRESSGTEALLKSAA